MCSLLFLVYSHDWTTFPWLLHPSLFYKNRLSYSQCQRICLPIMNHVHLAYYIFIYSSYSVHFCFSYYLDQALSDDINVDQFVDLTLWPDQGHGVCRKCKSANFVTVGETRSKVVLYYTKFILLVFHDLRVPIYLH